jgi:uncharacterized Zn finger protein (UPF0148 family)
MGLFGGKLGEIFCRACESTKTQQSKVAKEGEFFPLNLRKDV